MAKGLLLDMDGCITDFQREMLRRHKSNLAYEKVEWNFWTQMGITKEEFWSVADREFWANLPWTPEGEALLANLEKIVGRKNITLLSSPGVGSMDGKEDWIMKNIPQYSHQFIFGREKERVARPDLCLLDDSDQNVIQFKNAGGRSILLPRPWNFFSDKTNKDGTFKMRPLLTEVRRWWEE